MGTVVCPKCEKSDSIQKVSAIYTGGTSSFSYEVYGSGNKTAVSQTQLAERLKQPKEPPKPVSQFQATINALVSCAVAGIPSTLITFGVLNFLGISDSWFTAYIVAVVLWLIFAIPKIPELIRKATDAHTHWERQIANWWELYYCHRDDCIFDPRSGKTASASNPERLL